jgi:hypothetical protein
MWPTQRTWEQKEASLTPESPNVWLEGIPQLPYLDQFIHFMEAPIEKLCKLEKLTDMVYCHIRNYEFRKECKQKQEATARNIVVRQQPDQVRHNHEHKFTAETITKCESKLE